MLQKKNLKLLPLFLVLLLALGLWSSCEKYNSESIGRNFYPASSVVRTFTHLVYVEFLGNEARVWGPYAHEVESSIDGTQVNIFNSSDSLALFVYGYPAAGDSAGVTDCNIIINSSNSYALYLNKLVMRSQQKPAIKSEGVGNCYMVIPKSSKNEIYSVSSPSVLDFFGPVVLVGEGELTVSNETPSFQRPQQGTAVPVAFETQGGLYCQYDLKLNLLCPEGDAVRVSDGPMRSSLGTWTFEAGQNAISNVTDSIVLIAGTYTGVAREGKFFENPIGAVIRQAKVEGLSGQASDLLDTLVLHQHYDSVQVTLQQQFDSVIVHADSVLNIALKRNGSSAATFKPRFTIDAPWVVLSNSSLQPSDTLIVVKK